MLLPVNTPAYAVRTEFGLTKLRLVVFKLCLNYLKKIESMSDSRYPKGVLNMLREIYTRSDFPKYSWCHNLYKNFLTVLGEANMDYVFNGEFDFEIKQYLIRNLEKGYKDEDLLKAGSSRSLILYKFVDPIAQTRMYRFLNIKLNIKKAFAQLRLINLYSTRIILFNKCYLIKKALSCNICNKINLNFIHWVCDCPVVSNIRIDFGLEALNEISNDKLRIVFEDMNEIKIFDVCKYIVKILEFIDEKV